MMSTPLSLPPVPSRCAFPLSLLAACQARSPRLVMCIRVHYLISTMLLASLFGCGGTVMLDWTHAPFPVCVSLLSPGALEVYSSHQPTPLSCTQPLTVNLSPPLRRPGTPLCESACACHPRFCSFHSPWRPCPPRCRQGGFHLCIISQDRMELTVDGVL